MLASLFACLVSSRVFEVIEGCFGGLVGSRRPEFLQWIVGDRHQFDAAVQSDESELFAVAVACLLRNRHAPTFVRSHLSTYIRNEEVGMFNAFSHTQL